MLELPDVAVFKQYLDATALHQEITAVDVHAPEMLKRTTTDEFAAQLVTKFCIKPASTHRHRRTNLRMRRCKECSST